MADVVRSWVHQQSVGVEVGKGPKTVPGGDQVDQKVKPYSVAGHHRSVDEPQERGHTDGLADEEVGGGEGEVLGDVE